MSPKKTGKSRGRGREKTLRENLETRLQLGPERGWTAGGEADQDLAVILQEFQRNALKRRRIPPEFTRPPKRAAQPTEFGRLATDRSVQGETDDATSQLLEEARAHIVELMRRTGPDPSRRLEEGEQLEGYLREYRETKPNLTSQKGRVSGGEADQDLADIFREFQRRVSKRYEGPGSRTRVEAETQAEIKSGPRRPKTGGGSVQDGMEDFNREGLNQANAYSPESDPLEDSNAAQDSVTEDPVEEHLREFNEMPQTEDQEWEEVDEAEQDLVAIFQEFHSGASEKDERLSETEGVPGQFLPQEKDDPFRQLYESAKAFVLESIRRAGANRAPDLDEGARLVGQIIDSLAEHTGLLLIATEKKQPFSLGGHCVNVCIAGLRIAQTLKYSRGRCVHVGLAALLHEIGVVRAFARQIEFGMEEPTGELRQRPVFSAEILEKLCPEQDWLFLTVGQVCEREDGSGFPLGMEGKDIREEAKIVGIADLLESCIHDRPYRKALTGYQVMTDIVQNGTQSFSSPVVKALISSFSIYIYNEYVVLNTGEVGRVTEINPDSVMRPEIELLYDGEGEILPERQVVDLTNNSSRYVVKAVLPDDLPLKRTRKRRR